MRRGFTLIETVFVLLILAVLAGVAVPKFLALRENARVKMIVTTTINGAASAYTAAQNLANLDDNTTFKLKDILEIKAAGWYYNAAYFDGAWYCPNPEKTRSYGAIVLDQTKRAVVYRILCDAFEKESERRACERLNKESDQQFLYY